uniref:Endonuclease/exonuclease/phosphatase domain-containing protein n=1 Tax=Aegilops tauschii TaxID=37682 RepID=M8CM56_AEGTA
MAKVVLSLMFKIISQKWTSSTQNLQLILFLKHLKRCIWSPKCYNQEEEDDTEIDVAEGSIVTFEPNDETFGFTVKEAVLFPPEVEKGMWPENYSLSDHAPLTVVFSPIN